MDLTNFAEVTALLKRRGFQYRGNVLVRIEEGHDPRRQAFEKVLK